MKSLDELRADERAAELDLYRSIRDRDLASTKFEIALAWYKSKRLALLEAEEIESQTK